ncbi:hypothetical protein GQX74_010694 [Glossina fuscipes]|nr:hypothetical protein GQX74_010694 [Glossina fuscipes]
MIPVKNSINEAGIKDISTSHENGVEDSKDEEMDITDYSIRCVVVSVCREFLLGVSQSSLGGLKCTLDILGELLIFSFLSKIMEANMSLSSSSQFSVISILR